MLASKSSGARRSVRDEKGGKRKERKRGAEQEGCFEQGGMESAIMMLEGLKMQNLRTG
jgi:hypothetical protein